MSKRLITILLGIAAIVAIAAGCGGGDSTTALTKAEFIKQGDAICQKGYKRSEDEINAYVKEHNIPEGQKPTQAQQEEIVKTISLPSVAVQAEELGELGVPDGDGDKVDAIVEGAEDAVEKGEADPSSASGANGPLAKVSKLAQEYGFKVCGS